MIDITSSLIRSTRMLIMLFVLVWLFLSNVHAQEVPTLKENGSDLSTDMESLSNDLMREPLNTISVENVAEGLKNDTLVLLDVRSKEEYENIHIKGALNLPLTEMTKETLQDLIPNKDAKVVVYCDYHLAPIRTIALSRLGEPVLYKSGYNNLYQLETLWNKEGVVIYGFDTLTKDDVIELEGNNAPSP